MLIQPILCFLLGYVLMDLQSCFGVWVIFACWVLCKAFVLPHGMLV